MMDCGLLIGTAHHPILYREKWDDGLLGKRLRIPYLILSLQGTQI